MFLNISTSFGQGYFNNWYFESGAGLNFNSGTPVMIALLAFSLFLVMQIIGIVSVRKFNKMTKQR